MAGEKRPAEDEVTSPSFHGPPRLRQVLRSREAQASAAAIVAPPSGESPESSGGRCGEIKDLIETCQEARKLYSEATIEIDRLAKGLSAVQTAFHAADEEAAQARNRLGDSQAQVFGA